MTPPPRPPARPSRRCRGRRCARAAARRTAPAATTSSTIAAVVAGLERARGHQQPQTGLVDRVGQLVGAVGGVDVDQDGAGLRGGVLQDRPLRAVRRPDADAVALRDAGAHEAAGQGGDVAVELGPGPAPAAGHLDERLAVGVRRGGAAEVVADRLLEERYVGLAAGLGQQGCLGRRRGALGRHPRTLVTPLPSRPDLPLPRASSRSRASLCGPACRLHERPRAHERRSRGEGVSGRWGRAWAGGRGRPWGWRWCRTRARRTPRRRR